MMIDAGPRSIAEAIKHVESEAWKTAISSEPTSLKANDPFEFVDSGKSHKTPISMRMILQKKLNEKRDIQCYKARLVEHEFQQ